MLWLALPEPRLCGAAQSAGRWRVAHSHATRQVTVGPSALEQYEYMQNAGQARFTQLPNYVRCPSPRSEAVGRSGAGRAGSDSALVLERLERDGRPHCQTAAVLSAGGLGGRGSLTVQRQFDSAEAIWQCRGQCAQHVGVAALGSCSCVSFVVVLTTMRGGGRW